MKVILFAVAALFLASPVWAAKPCEELKSEIAAKLDGMGVKGYTLEVVATGSAPAGAQVVGSCEGGSKEIAYQRK